MNAAQTNLLLTSLDQIYLWANSEDGPSDALLSSTQLLGGTKAVFLQLSMVANDDYVLAESGLGMESAAKLADFRDNQDNFLAHFRSWDQDNVYDGERLRPDYELSESTFHNDFLKPNNLRYAIAGVVTRTRTSCIVLCCYRSADKTHFGSTEMANLRQILPHWRRALDLKNRLTQMDRHSEASHRILDHAPFSIMLMDSNRTILYANYWANIIGKRNDGLGVRNSRLVSDSPYSTQKILGVLELADQPQDKESASPALIAIERPSGEKPYQLMILPILSVEEAGIATGPVYGVFIYDPKDRLPVDTAALISLESLTESEAKLCESLYETKSLSKTADQLQVSSSTAKTHLLNTFRKLGINSQAELMRYLAHMPKLSSEQLQ